MSKDVQKSKCEFKAQSLEGENKIIVHLFFITVNVQKTWSHSPIRLNIQPNISTKQVNWSCIKQSSKWFLLLHQSWSKMLKCIKSFKIHCEHFVNNKCTTYANMWCVASTFYSMKKEYETGKKYLWTIKFYISNKKIKQQQIISFTRQKKDSQLVCCCCFAIYLHYQVFVVKSILAQNPSHCS